ncbi:MAG: transcription-repair coupling factor [Gammaproteobacteria bacterium]
MLSLTLPTPKPAGQQAYLHGLHQCAQYLSIYHYLQSHKGIVVLLTATPLQAQQYYDALRYLCKDDPWPIEYFPHWETLPYDNFSPHQDIISTRLRILAQLPHQSRGLIILPITTLVHPVAAPQHIGRESFYIRVGDALNPHDFRQQLEQCGYYCTSQVLEHGEFALRGSLLDLFPMGSPYPFRIDLFDDTVDSIRTFDVETQRTIETINTINCLPAREFPLTEKAIQHFRQQWRSEFAGDPTQCSFYKSISSGLVEAGIEYYLPLFFDKAYTLLDYLPANTLIMRTEKISDALEHFNEEVKHRYEQKNIDKTKPLLSPQKLLTPAADLFGTLKNYSQIILTSQTNQKPAPFENTVVPSLPLNHKASAPLTQCEKFLSQYPEARVLFSVESAGRRETLLELLKNSHIIPSPVKNWKTFFSGNEKIGIMISPLTKGIILPQHNLIIITESELFGERVHQERRRFGKKVDADAVIRNLTELQEGSAVVHIDHGIGRYCGLQVINHQGEAAEYLTLEYAKGAKLYVPVSSLNRISRYGGIDGEHAPLHHLGSGQWDKEKRKAAEKVADVAAELLTIYAKRAASKGHGFPPINEQYHSFAAEFPFEETVDQEQAIDNVIKDMTAPKTMDRLICGDVGFGKTEVAIRAAFIAVQGGKQVALLAPTTLLAQQHFEAFKDRFANWPVVVEGLSRFKTAKERKLIIEKLKNGTIDIVAGTHALLSDNVHFKDLGLLIIDEEHRFGVKHKDKLKALRSHVDILTLTATPIPRSLNLAMSGMRDLSLMATPPAKRLSIRTFVHERDDALIRESILRELMRGGQVYFLHNKVATIEKTAQELQAAIPEARITIAHGQMRESDLEKVMSDFYHQRTNVLVCTTIIESGIDVPTANTIIMDRADHLGLAQLHQLRGRVGRSHHQAYAYLLTPPPKLMTKDAHRRLEAIASLEDLGAGFTLATHDLEIRGAGNLLGEEQSGHIQAIGFSLYMVLLEKAVKSLEKGETLSIDKLTQPTDLQLELPLPTLIPEDYLPDPHERLILYKRIAHCQDNDALQHLKVEIIDRFGLLPQVTENLFCSMKLRLQGEALGVASIKATTQKATLVFKPNPLIETAKLVQLVREKPHQYSIAPDNGFVIKWPKAIDGHGIIDHLKNLLDTLVIVQQG